MDAGCRSKKTVSNFLALGFMVTFSANVPAVALARYQSIVEAPDFGDLDYDSVDPKATKPTKGVMRVNDLLETITGAFGYTRYRYPLLITVADRYRPLSSFSQKLTFLIDIQIAIFDKLHEKLQSNLEAYLTMTTALGRAMGSVTKEEQDKLLGVEGIERLCKTYGSADYLEKAMRDWSDDVVGRLCKLEHVVLRDMD